MILSCSMTEFVRMHYKPNRFKSNHSKSLISRPVHKTESTYPHQGSFCKVDQMTHLIQETFTEDSEILTYTIKP